MSLLESLLDAIIRLDGDALVMHVGEKPYVVTTSEATNEFRGPLAWGQVELSTRILTAEAVLRMVGQILPEDHRYALNEYGATEHEVTAASDASEVFTIVAARGGDDIWLEVRRLSKHRLEPSVSAPAAERVPAPAAVEAAPALVAVGASAHQRTVADVPPRSPDTPPAPERIPVSQLQEDEFDLDPGQEIDIDIDGDGVFNDSSPGGEPLGDEPHALDAVASIISNEDWGDDVMTESDLGELLRASAAALINDEAAAAIVEAPRAAEAQACDTVDPVADVRADVPGDEPAGEPGLGEGRTVRDEEVEAEGTLASGDEEMPTVSFDEMDFSVELELFSPDSVKTFDSKELEVPDDSQQAVPKPVLTPFAATQPTAVDTDAEAVPVSTAEGRAAEEEPAPARPVGVVVPLTRQGRADAPSEVRGGTIATLQRLLRLAAARGAMTVHVVAQSAPMVRVDGEFSTLDGEPVLNIAFVERLTVELTQARENATPSGEWIADVPEIGRVRCVMFRDHRGPGLIFRMIPPRAIAAEQLGLPAEVQALCSEADGLVLVAGGLGSGRSTLLTSFVDLINRMRSDYVITTEPQIEFVHENKRSLVSQREVRGTGDAVAGAVRSALREEPDVLVIEDLNTPELVALALEAAESGRLVFASVAAVSSVAAVERVLEMCPAERRETAQASLASTLRGVVAQVLLRKLKGGRVAAREVLINTPAVAALIAEGRLSQLPELLENGRAGGMISFAESLGALVREGAVHPSHAQRKAPKPDQLLAVLRRDGVDTSATERRA